MPLPSAYERRLDVCYALRAFGGLIFLVVLFLPRGLHRSGLGNIKESSRLASKPGKDLGRARTRVSEAGGGIYGRLFAKVGFELLIKVVWHSLLHHI